MALRQGATPLKRSARRPWLALLSTACVLLSAGCSLLTGSGDASNTPGIGGLEKSTIRVAVVPEVNTAPFFIAQAKGYFQQEGLTVQLQTVADGAQNVSAVGNNNADIGYSDWTTLFAAQANRAGNFRIVADGAQGSPGSLVISALPGTGINSIQNLVNRRVGLNAANNVVQLALFANLEANNIDRNGVRYTVVNYVGSEAALSSHQVDAVGQTEPFLTKTEKDLGARPVVDLFGQGPTADLPLAGYFATSDFVTQNPKTLAAFQRALAKGAADAANRVEVENVLPSYLALDKQTAQLINLPDFPPTLNAIRLQRVANLMTQYGLINGRLDVKTMLAPQPTAAP